MNAVEALSCQELVELVTDYLEGALAPGDLRRFEEHIAGCGKCTTYLAQMRETIRVTGTLTPDDVSLPQSESCSRSSATGHAASSGLVERDRADQHARLAGLRERLERVLVATDRRGSAGADRDLRRRGARHADADGLLHSAPGDDDLPAAGVRHEGRRAHRSS